MSRQPYQVFVHISEARGLVGLSDNHMSDAYAVLRIGPTARLQRKTEAKLETVNAVWESKFMFEDVMLSEDEFRKEKLSIAVYDRNDFYRNQLIGSHEFSLTNIQRQKSSQYDRKWFPLTLPDQPGQIRGYILVTTFVLRPGADTPQDEDRDAAAENDQYLLSEPNMANRAAYMLNVLIYRGQHILENSQLPVGGARNPFVTVRFNGNVAQTQHVYNTGAPTWNYKLSLPFNMPLTSESIEIQLWNHLGNRPAQLISEEVFNYYNQGLAHKAWGPRWVNLYSSEYDSKQVSLLGGIKDLVDASGRNNPAKSEYVGRVLVRMSVLPVEKYNQRLVVAPCNPVAMPPTVEYCLDLLLYSSLEIPVMGGQIKVEVTFGDRRAESSRKLGKDGVFTWMETMQPVYNKHDKLPEENDPMRLSLRVHGPADLEQLHDIVISVYHIVGGSVRKIGFLRLKPVNMLPQARLDTYFVNGQYAIPKRGMVSERMLQQMWSPRWYTLHHTHPDQDNPHLVAGFLLMSIGFGIAPMRPAVVPRPISKPKQRFTLRAYIYHAANLLAADPTTISANPFMVLRFGDASYRTRTMYNTTFPYWCEWADLGPVSIDKENPPCVFLQVFHQTQLQYKLIGRTDILGQHVLHNTNGALYRYQLYFDPHEGADDEQHGGDDDATLRKAARQDPERSPYVLACFQLLPYVKDPEVRFDRYPLKSDWVPADESGAAAAEERNDESDDENAKQAQDDEDEDDVTIGARVKLVEGDNDSSETKKLRKTRHSYLDNPDEIFWRPRLAEFACKLEMVGLRNLRNWKLDPDCTLKIEATLPNLDMIARTWHKSVSEDEMVCVYRKESVPVIEGTSLQLMDSKEWPRVKIPLDNPNGVALRVRVWNEGAAGDELLGVSFLHLFQQQLIDTSGVDVVVPPFYRYKGYYDKTVIDSDEKKIEQVEEEEEEKSADEDDDVAFDDSDDDNVRVMDKEAAPLNLADLGIELADMKRKRDDVAGGAQAAQTDTVNVVADDDDDGENEKKRKQYKYKGEVDKFGNPVLGEVDDEHLNVHADAINKDNKLIVQGYQQQTKTNAVDDDLLDEQSQFQAPLSMALMSGKQIGFSHVTQSLLQIQSDVHWRQVGIIRLYFSSRLVPSSDVPRELKNATEDELEAWRHRQNLQRQKVVQEVRDIDNLGWLQDKVYSERYVTRLYVYEGKYLTPRESFFTGNQTATPFLVVSNAPDPDSTINNREMARVNTLHPQFSQVFELQTELPRNHMLEVHVWNKDDLTGDTVIGTVYLDVEDLLMNSKTRGTSTFYSLNTDQSVVSQGKLRMKLDLLTEDEARRVRADDLTAQEPEEYEVRMVIWSTREVTMPDEKDKDKDIDQKIYVTTNFDGIYGGDEIKSTDTAWYSSNGSAEWNWRFKWRMRVPCQVPRIKMSIWEDNTIMESEAIGELNYSLQPFIDQMLRDKKGVAHRPQQWLPFTHPNFPGAVMGEVCLEFWLLARLEADNSPVGEAQDEPNQNPFLPAPVRNPPPWAIGSRAINWIGRRKLLIAIAAFLIVAIVIVIISVYLSKM